MIIYPSAVNRTKILTSYLDNMKSYLKLHFPNITEEKIEDFVRTTIKDNLKNPKTQILNYPSYGNIELIESDLLTVINKSRDKVIAPSGTVFESADKKTPSSKKFIDCLMNNRNKAKKEMFDFLVEGKIFEASLKNFEQYTDKVRANSWSGSTGTEYSSIYDLESFNSITSMARHGIILAYTFTERFLTNNHYFPTEQSIYEFIMAVIKHAPDDEIIKNLKNKYNLFIPLPCQVANSLLPSIKLYHSNYTSIMIELNYFLEKLTQSQLTYLFYSRNLYNLLHYNEPFFKPFIRDLFDTDQQIVVDNTLDPTLITKVEGDLLCAVTTICDKYLDGTDIKKIAEKNPHNARLLLQISRSIENKLNSISDLLNIFLYGNEFIPNIPKNRYIKRKSVAISDTDSVLFTTANLVSWFLNNNEETKFKQQLDYNPPSWYENSQLKISQNGFNIHALIVYWMTKSMDHLIKLMAIARGAINDDVKRIIMKNEFLYVVLIKTNLGKHYAGLITIREGRILPEPKLDIKGVAFRSSNLPKITHDFTQKTLTTLIYEIYEHGDIYAGDMIHMALEYERSIFDNINSGELTYFGNISIKNKNEYKDSFKSIYFNYELWTEVFAEDYGTIHIPGKYMVIPILSKKFKSLQYLDWLHMRKPKVADNLEKFLSNYKKKNITRLPLPATALKIPDIFIPVVDKRKIVYKNIAPCQLALRSINIDLGNQKKTPLFSDVYTNVDSDNLCV